MQIFFKRISDVIWPCFRFLKQDRYIPAILPNVFFNKNILMKTGQIHIAHIVYLRFNNCNTVLRSVISDRKLSLDRLK